MAKRILWTLLALQLLPSCSSEPSSQQTPPVKFDHIIVGVSNLEAGIQDLEQLTGVRAELGGVHPGEGTRNALISLGEGAYLELYAPNPEETIVSPIVTELQNLQRLKPMYWAVSTTDVNALRAHFDTRGLPLSLPEAGSRVRPDGSVVKWVMFYFGKFDHSLAPFFIRWEQPELHPSRTSPGGCKLVSIRLQDPAPMELKAAIQPLGLGVPVDQGTEKQ
ncbi:MAG TPA: VOC family protein, partial [Sphingomicrobium sp.]|nr:VOC family protein [Sphingomicrobium sp.]